MPDIYENKLKINTYEKRLKNSLMKKLEVMKLKYEKCMSSVVFKDPYRRINDEYVKLDFYLKRLETKIESIHKEKKTILIEKMTKLDTLSPLKTLIRGYCLTEKDGKMIKSAKQLRKGDKINIRYTDGTKEAEIIT